MLQHAHFSKCIAPSHSFPKVADPHHPQTKKMAPITLYVPTFLDLPNDDQPDVMFHDISLRSSKPHIFSIVSLLHYSNKRYIFDIIM